jgi:hypothetical protein
MIAFTGLDAPGPAAGFWQASPSADATGKHQKTIWRNPKRAGTVIERSR